VAEIASLPGFGPRLAEAVLAALGPGAANGAGTADTGEEHSGQR
jgi:hypothetical protein